MSIIKKRMIPVTTQYSGIITETHYFQNVQKYDPVVTVLMDDGGEVDITSPYDGYVMPVNAETREVTRTDVVAYIMVDPQILVEVKPIVRGRIAPPNPTTIVEYQEQLYVPPIIQAEYPLLKTEAQPEPTYFVDPKESEYATTNYTVTIAKFQRRGVNEYRDELIKRGEDYKVAELTRLAFHLLLSTPYNTVIRKLDEQRDYERRHGYGTGTRPIKRRHRKPRPI